MRLTGVPRGAKSGWERGGKGDYHGSILARCRMSGVIVTDGKRSESVAAGRNVRAAEIVCAKQSEGPALPDSIFLVSRVGGGVGAGFLFIGETI